LLCWELAEITVGTWLELTRLAKLSPTSAICPFVIAGIDYCTVTSSFFNGELRISAAHLQLSATP